MKGFAKWYIWAKLEMYFLRKRETCVSSIFRSQISQVCRRWITLCWASASNSKHVGYVTVKLQETLWDKKLEVKEAASRPSLMSRTLSCGILDVSCCSPVYNKIKQYATNELAFTVESTLSLSLFKSVKKWDIRKRVWQFDWIISYTNSNRFLAGP